MKKTEYSVIPFFGPSFTSNVDYFQIKKKKTALALEKMAIRPQKLQNFAYFGHLGYEDIFFHRFYDGNEFLALSSQDFRKKN